MDFLKILTSMPKIQTRKRRFKPRKNSQGNDSISRVLRIIIIKKTISGSVFTSPEASTPPCYKMSMHSVAKFICLFSFRTWLSKNASAVNERPMVRTDPTQLLALWVPGHSPYRAGSCSHIFGRDCRGMEPLATWPPQWVKWSESHSVMSNSLWPHEL